VKAKFIAICSVMLMSVTGCAVNIVSSARDDQYSDDLNSVVTGRMNYVIDGKVMTPYGAFRPAWPAPFLNAVNLETGEVHAFPAVAIVDGSFRWRVRPGAYVVTRIGFGNFSDDTFISWPRIVLCVPRTPGVSLYVGHLRLEGRSYAEDVKLSTGTRYTVRGVRYHFEVADEAPDTPARIKRLMRHIPDMPIGDALVARWKADSQGLERTVCGELLRL
jgi:hypothetical protein